METIQMYYSKVFIGWVANKHKNHLVVSNCGHAQHQKSNKPAFWRFEDWGPIPKLSMVITS